MIHPKDGKKYIIKLFELFIDNIDNKYELNNIKNVVAIEQDLIKTENTYKSCCLVADRRALQFFSQFIFH